MWTESEGVLYQRFEFGDFSQAFAFMGRVALLAESHQHHPRWTNVYNRVDIWLSAHEAGGKITEKDRKLAQAIDELV